MTTIISGAVAAYLLYKRGVPLHEIAKDVVTHPISSMGNELHVAAPQPSEADDDSSRLRMLHRAILGSTVCFSTRFEGNGL